MSQRAAMRSPQRQMLLAAEAGREEEDERKAQQLKWDSSLLPRSLLLLWHSVGALWAALLLLIPLGRVATSAEVAGSRVLTYPWWVSLALLCYTGGGAVYMAWSPTRAGPSRLLRWRDHWYFVASASMMLPFLLYMFRVLPMSSPFIATGWLGDVDAGWPSMVCWVFIKIDTAIVPHQSRGGPSLLLPTDVLFVLFYQIAFIVIQVVCQAVINQSQYGDSILWAPATAALCAGAYGGFFLMYGFTLGALKLRAEVWIRRSLAANRVRVAKNIRYLQSGVDDWYAAAKHTLDVWSPGSAAHAMLSMPTIVFVHGGMYRFGSKWSARNVGHAWASRGAICVVPNYRLRPCASIDQAVDDVAGAVAWTMMHIHEFGGDPSNVYLAGHSAGAHAVTAVGLYEPLLRQYAGHMSFPPLVGVFTISAVRLAGNSGSHVPTDLVAACKADSVPRFCLIAGGGENKAVLDSHGHFVRACRTYGVQCVSTIVHDASHVGEIMEVGITDPTDAMDPITSVVMDVVTSIAEHKP